MKMLGNIKNDSTYRMAYYAVASLPDTNARSPSITVRPSSTALLTIDSEDRYKDYIDARANPTSPYNFTIRKPENMMAGFFTRLAVTEVNFPFTIPNINRKTNEIGISYEVSGSPVALASIILTNGFYTPSQLAEEIQAQVSAIPALSAFTMTYGAIAPIGSVPFFEYNTNTATTIAFNPLPYNSAGYPFPPTTKQLFDVLGFNETNTTQQIVAPSGYTFCQAIRYIDIVANVLTSVSALKDQTSQPIVRDMLCRVYLGDGGGTGQSTTPADASGFCPPGCSPFTIYRNFTNPKQIQWIPNQNIPGCLQFQVYDDAGDLLSNSLEPTTIGQPSQDELATDWSMTILVSEN